MKVFRTTDRGVEPVELYPFKTEKDIQELVEKNTSTFINLEFLRTEFPVRDFRIDTLRFNNETNSFFIIEYKKGIGYCVIYQGYCYLSLMLNNKYEIVIEYIERLNRNLRRDDVDWT